MTNIITITGKSSWHWISQLFLRYNTNNTSNNNNKNMNWTLPKSFFKSIFDTGAWNRWSNLRGMVGEGGEWEEIKGFVCIYA